MGRVSWPLIDIRQDSFGNWFLNHITSEAFTVPISPDPDGLYVVYQVEVPAPAGLNGSNPAPIIQCPVGVVLNLVDHPPVNGTEVFVDYSRGYLVFHSSKAGVVGVADYWGKGSLVEAADVNELNTRVQALELAPPDPGATGVRGQTGTRGIQGVQGITGLVGIQGLRGATGLLGGTGLRGPSGPQGLTGIGSRGYLGATGLPGSRGATGGGLPGSTGLRGPTGPNGARGVTGPSPAITGRYQSPTFTTRIWTVNHNLGDPPVVQTFGSDNKALAPTEILNGAMVTYVTFASSTTGYAVCVLGGERGLRGATGLGGIKGSTGVAAPPTARYRRVISAPSSVWVLNHGLLWEPMIQAFDGSGRLLNPTGIVNGTSVSTIYLPTAQVGYALAIAGGYYGPTGVKGVTGGRGVTGFGVRGPTGPAGQGVTGQRGLQGVTGPKGSTGPKGYTGSRGIIGPQGATGPRGMTGAKGSTGLRGRTGLRGHTGTGVRGPTGAKGVTGFRGATGTGPQGVTGLKGATGARGLRGVTGPVANLMGMAITLVNNATAIPTGIGGDIRIMQDCRITKASMLAGETGTVQIDLWKSTYATYPPVLAGSITGGNPLRINGGIKMEDAVLTGWDGNLDRGEILRFNVDGCNNIKYLHITLEASLP